MKAIIPVAGAGTRLRPLTYTQPKPLIPVAGKPIISFIIDQMAEVGVEEFIFVIGYLGEKIQDFIEHNYPDLKTTFVKQDQRLGTGHAIWMAKEALRGEEDVFIFFGDGIVDINIQDIVDLPQSCLCVKQVDDPRNFGVVEYDEEGYAKRVVEKPKIPKSNMALVGFYKIKEVDVLLNALEQNIINDYRPAGEFSLTDGIQQMIEKGIRFVPKRVNSWFNCGKKEVLLETNALLLDREGYASANLPGYDNSIIIHPVSIGKGCEISNAIVGPHVTIGENAVIESAIIKNSIIGNYASISEAVLQASIIGNDTAITGLRQSLNIGDNTEIDFSS